jgi:two-component system CheB/CheR fusion protein
MRGPSDSPLRVLVVDDNADTAAIFAMLLRIWGHEVRTTHDGPSALELAQEFRPDAVLLDIGLPNMDGFEVAAHLRSLPEFARILIVGSSGYSRESDRRRAGEVGIDLYLVKPFDPWQLESILDSHRATLEAVPA